MDSARGILGGQKMFGFAVLGVIIQRIPAIKDEKKYVETLGGWVFRVAISKVIPFSEGPVDPQSNVPCPEI